MKEKRNQKPRVKRLKADREEMRRIKYLMRRYPTIEEFLYYWNLPDPC